MAFDNLVATNSRTDVYQYNNLAVKLFKKGYDKSLVLYEAMAHSLVEKTGIRIPILREVSVTDGQWAIKMDYITGKTFAQLIEETPQKMNEYVERMVDIQLDIHSRSLSDLHRVTKKIEDQIDGLDCLDESKKYELLYRLDKMPKHKKLCHGNFQPLNIIAARDGDYVLNWVDAGQGNASGDVATTYLLLNLTYPKEVAEKYMELFCKKTDTDMSYVQDWLPIVAAARLAENRKEEREFLFNWLNEYTND